MSVIREVEEQINQYAPIYPLSKILNDTMRQQDYPNDAILYGEVVTAIANYYTRVCDHKAYMADQAQDTETEPEGE